MVSAGAPSALDCMLPRFKWGDIAPGEGGAVRRGANYQFYKLVPTDIMEISAGRGQEELLNSGNAGDIELAVANFWEAVDQLAKEKVDVIVIGGAPVSAYLGRPLVLQLIRETKEKYGIPVTGPLEAFLAGAHHLGVETVTVGSRWVDSRNQRIVEYLADGGVEVVGMTTRHQTHDLTGKMTFEEGLHTALDVGREAARKAPQADGIFVPGGAALSAHVLPALESEFGKPAFTNLSSEVWQVLVHPGVIPPVQGWGKLLATP